MVKEIGIEIVSNPGGIKEKTSNKYWSREFVCGLVTC